MSLRGIDISSWQEDLNIGSMSDTDFVIVKATGGNGYSNPAFQKHMLQGFGSGKLMGCYHFAQESSCKGTAREEAEHFVRAFTPYIGRAIPFLDWEAEALNQHVSWAREWLDYVAEATGATPGIYMSKSVCSSQDWSSVAGRYPLWVAQYGSMEQTGWQDSPWTDANGYGAWDSPTLFQYSSAGRVAGYGGDLDINIFYGDRSKWEAMCVGSQVKEDRMASCADIAARIHADMCDDDSNGYSWSPRWGGSGRYKTLSIDGRDYTYEVGSYDCSSSVITAWRLAIQYTSYAGSLDGATYTGDMRSVFVGSGLFDVWDVNSTNAVRGDLYLNDNQHVAMCQDGGSDGVYGYDALSEFADSENGDNYDNQMGDQTGYEASVHGFYTPGTGWNCTLHYNGKADSSQGESGGNAIIQPNYDVPVPDVKFRVKTKNGWLAEKVEGDGGEIVGIAIDFGGNGWYQVKTKKHGWLESVRGYDVDDDENGYAGYEDSPVIAVRAYYETPDPNSTGYFSAKYKAADKGKDYWPWQYDTDTNNGQDGYAGDDVPIDRFYIELAR